MSSEAATLSSVESAADVKKLVSGGGEQSELPSTLEGYFVTLENLPCLFSEATLMSMTEHVPKKGKILSAGVMELPGREVKLGYVSFEKHEDTEAAIRLWDQLAVDGSLISARSGMPPTPTPRPIPQQLRSGAPNASKARAAPSTIALRYPFAPMSIGWLVEHVNLYKQPNKSYAMVRILECLMNTAVMTEDPYMEYAVVNFYTKFTPVQWGKAQSVMADVVPFELSRQVFEVIGLVRKFPSANVKSRKMLLGLVERLSEDIVKVTAEHGALKVGTAIPEVIRSIQTQLDVLKDAEKPFSEAHKHLLSWLKILFTCVQASNNTVPVFPEQNSFIFCSETCPCYSQLKNKFTFVLGDVEKAKIVDSLIISAVRDSDEYTGTIAQELWERYSLNFMYRAVKHIQNGKFLLLRLTLFRAIYTSRKVKSFDTADIGRYYDIIETALHDIKEETQDHPELKTLGPLVGSAFQTLLELRSYADICPNAVQQLYTLQFDLAQIFNALCVPQYHLCVHFEVQGANKATAEPSAPTPTTKPTKCGNPLCEANSDSSNLLKCSGCKVTFYCSVDCQRGDWKSHKTFCRELAARKATVDPPEPYREERVLMPSFPASRNFIC